MANMTLVQARANVDAASQKHSAYLIEAEQLERKIKEASVELDDLEAALKAIQDELAASEAALDSAKKFLDKVNSDPGATDEDKAKALASYNEALNRVEKGKDEVEENISATNSAKAVLKALENSEILKLVQESLEAMDAAEAAYQREIERRNSDSLAGDASSDYGLDPLARYQNCQKLQGLIQKNVQVAGLGKTKIEYGRGALNAIEKQSIFNQPHYSGTSDLLIAYDKLKWNGNLDEFGDMVATARAKANEAMKEGMENLFAANDSKSRTILQSNIDAYANKYKGLFDVKIDDGMKARAVDFESAEYASKEVEVPGSKTSIITYYDAGYQTMPAGDDAWYKISEETRIKRDEIVKAYTQMKADEEAYDMIKRFDMKQFEALTALIMKANEMTEEAALTALGGADVFEPGSPDATAQLLELSNALDKSGTDFIMASDSRNKMLDVYKKEEESKSWLNAAKNAESGYLRYVKGDADFSGITTNYEWVVVIVGSECFLSAKGSVEAFDQFKNILNSGKFASVEANGESVLSKGVEEWVECQKFIADYEEKQEVTETYSDVITTALAGFDSEAQAERSELAKKLIEIPNANIAKALSQVKNIKFEDVAVAIKKAILKGKYSCLIEGFVEATVLKHLIDQGYQVSEVLDDIDHTTGKQEATRDGAPVSVNKDIATKIAWDGAIADYTKAKDQQWYKFEWDKIPTEA